MAALARIKTFVTSVVRTRELTPGMRRKVARVLLEIPDAGERQELDTSGDVEVTWLHLDVSDGGTSRRLLDAVVAADLPPGVHYAWGAAESRGISAVRRHLRQERGLRREAVCMVGYWRHATHPYDPAEEDDEPEGTSVEGASVEEASVQGTSVEVDA